MSDAGLVFETTRLRDEVFALRKKYRFFFERLRRIPHLRLNLPCDLAKIKQEVASIDEWCPIVIESQHWTAADVEIFSRTNQGRALVEFIPDSRFLKDTNSRNRPREKCMFRPDGRLSYFPTDLLMRMPETRRLIYSVCDYPCRTRLMRTAPGYNIPWHSHHMGNVHNEPYFLGVIQVPVFSEDIVYKVPSFNPRFPAEYTQIYPEGEAYIFNSYHDHAVVNDSGKHRISLFMTFNLDYEPFIQRILPDVIDYGGPLIEEG